MRFEGNFFQIKNWHWHAARKEQQAKTAWSASSTRKTEERETESEAEKERWDVSCVLPLFNQDVGAPFSTMPSTTHVYLVSLEPVFVLSMCTRFFSLYLLFSPLFIYFYFLINVHASMLVVQVVLKWSLVSQHRPWRNLITCTEIHEAQWVISCQTEENIISSFLGSSRPPRGGKVEREQRPRPWQEKKWNQKPSCEG